jgi:kumamolisin
MRSHLALSLLTALALLLGLAESAVAQRPAHRLSQVTTPKSSRELPADASQRAHTTILLVGTGPMQPDGQVSEQAGGPPFPGYAFETPASLACLYNLVRTTVPGCNPNVVDTNPNGGSRAIAIVDAYDDPNAMSDLANFSAQFGLPPANFHVVYAAGTNPGLDPTGGWELEESLDIEYSHAMAPNAELFLVEAASESIPDLLKAEMVAAQIVARHGGGEVSNSWGILEFPQELQLDSVFTQRDVVYFASSGDGPGTIWPSVSPNVVAAGGTSTNRSPYTGNILYEGTWTYGGGGPSEYESRPSYQNGIAYLAGPSRVVPDISADANPITGVWILDSNLYDDAPGGWFIVGGTSVSSQVLAGITNAAGSFNKSSREELYGIYSALGHGSQAFNDIQRDNCGPYGGFLATPGYDFCTGVGSPNGYSNK